MQQIKEMEAGKIYLIEGRSTANSSYFEKEDDCKWFLSLADKYLSEYLEINYFQNSRHGWAMIVTTKSTVAIRQAYENRRKRSNKCKKAFEFHEIWRMLSDQFRILLSTYVKLTNARSGRTGGKVHSNYQRYVFESIEEVESVKQQLSKLNYDQAQQRKRYRPSKKLFPYGKKQMRRSIYMCCGGLTTVEKIKELGLSCLNLAGLNLHVLRKIVYATIKHHFPPDSLNKSTSLIQNELNR